MINTRIGVPNLTDEDQLRRILDHRVQAVVGGEGSAEILDGGGLARLWAVLRERVRSEPAQDAADCSHRP
jgi:hypothetical protein